VNLLFFHFGRRIFVRKQPVKIADGSVSIINDSVVYNGPKDYDSFHETMEANMRRLMKKEKRLKQKIRENVGFFSFWMERIISLVK